MKNTAQSNTQSNWVQYLYTSFVALLPFIYSSKGVDPVLIPRHFALALFSLLFAFFLWQKKPSKLTITSWVPLLFLAFGACYWLSIYQAINTEEAVYIATKVSSFVAFFWLINMGVSQNLLNLQNISKAIAISGILAFALAVRDMVYLQSQGIDIFSNDNMYKVTASFGHKNLLSAYIFICLPMLMMQLLYYSKWSWRMLICLAIVMQFIVLLMLQTRAIMLAGFVSGFVVIGMIGRSKLISVWQKKASLVTIICLVVGVATSSFVFRSKLNLITRTESFIERKNVWNNTLQMIADYPLLGVGSGNWQIHFPNYGMAKFYEINYTISEGITNFQRPHNDFLWVWSETGIVGMLIFVAIFCLTIFNALRNIKKAESLNQQWKYTLLLAQVIGFICISLVDFPLERIEHYIIILSAIAILSNAGIQPVVRHIHKVWLVFIIVFSVYVMWLCSKRWQSELALKKVHKAHTLNRWDSIITLGKKALTPQTNMDYFSIPIAWYIGVGYFMKNNNTEAKAYFEQAYKLHPYQVHVLNNYAACFVNDNNYEKAIALLEESFRISPVFSEGILNLSGAYFNVGRIDDAYRTLLRFRYDDQNGRFKIFALAILKEKLEKAMIGVPQNKKNAFYKLKNNDQQLLLFYKEAQLNNMDFMTYTDATIR